jgi:4'-phosphopantetheinyl transferase
MDGDREAARARTPERIRIERGEVHLWWGRMGAAEDRDAVCGWLSDEERRRGERFQRERDAREFRFRRAFRRVVLAPYLGASPDAVRFTAGRFGKPGLADEPELAFNGSSRGGVVLLAVARGTAVGVDVEHVGGAWADPEEIARLVPRVATPAEERRFQALAADARVEAFARLWTRKEALLKALGTGLALPPRSVAVGFGDERSERGAERPFAPRARWLALAAPEGFAASAVVLPDLRGAA